MKFDTFAKSAIINKLEKNPYFYDIVDLPILSTLPNQQHLYFKINISNSFFYYSKIFEIDNLDISALEDAIIDFSEQAKDDYSRFYSYDEFVSYITALYRRRYTFYNREFPSIHYSIFHQILSKSNMKLDMSNINAIMHYIDHELNS